MSHTELDHVRLAAEFEKANRNFITALRLGHCPASNRNLIWRREHPINRDVQRRYETSYHVRRDDIIEQLGLRVDRDGCTYCGTRRDIGCQHHPRQAA